MADVSSTLANISSNESGNAPAGNTAVGTTLDDNLRMIQALFAGLRDANGWGGLRLSVSGTNTVTASVSAQGSVSVAPSALAAGMRFHFTPANSNTGAAVINVASLGNKSIFLNGGALVGYELRKNCPVILEYDGTQMNLVGGAHGGDGIPIGTISSRGFSTAPSGHLLCDGTAVSRVTYADLFAVLGTTWGVGDGSSTFNVPSLARRALVGSGGSGTATLANSVGSTGGEETHTLTSGETPLVAHTHALASIRESDGGGGAAGGFQPGTTNNLNSTTTIAFSSGQGGTTGTASAGGSAHNVMQPSAVVYMVIKT